MALSMDDRILVATIASEYGDLDVYRRIELYQHLAAEAREEATALEERTWTDLRELAPTESWLAGYSESEKRALYGDR